MESRKERVKVTHPVNSLQGEFEKLGDRTAQMQFCEGGFLEVRKAMSFSNAGICRRGLCRAGFGLGVTGFFNPGALWAKDMQLVDLPFERGRPPLGPFPKNVL